MKTTTYVMLSLALALPLAACDKSKGGDDSKTEKPKDEDEVAAKADQDADAGDEDPPASPPEGYTSHLMSALTELGTGAAITTAQTKAYGCSVKYGDGGGEPTAKLGEPAPAFTLPNLAGEEVSLSDFAGKTVVLEWFNPDCPFVKYAHAEGGPLASLGNEQTKAGVVWLAINSGAEGNQGAGVDRNKQAKADWKLEHPVLIDQDGAVGHAYGAQTTPHMFVIDAEGKLVYAGAVDNAPLGRVEG